LSFLCARLGGGGSSKKKLASQLYDYLRQTRHCFCRVNVAIAQCCGEYNWIIAAAGTGRLVFAENLCFAIKVLIIKDY